MIELVNVSKQYDNKVWALKNISLRIEKGEFVYLVGPSGSGKSTLMKLLNRQEQATAGKVQVDQFKVDQLKRNQLHLLRRQVGIVFQDFCLLPQATVAENVAYALEVTGKSNKSIKKRVNEVLDLVNLRAKMNQLPS